MSSPSAPSKDIKRVIRSARITDERPVAGSGLGGAGGRHPLFFFLVTRVQSSGMKSDKVTVFLMIFGIGPHHGFKPDFDF